MLRNYLKIALRSLKKRLGYTAINVIGFALGMACCLLIFMLVRTEWSYDRFHEKADRIYRTSLEYYSPEGELQYQNMMFPDFTPALAQEFPGIEHATRFVQGEMDLWIDNQAYRKEMTEVDSTFFELFSFPLIVGDPVTVLDDPSGMVITEETAKTLFGYSRTQLRDAIGKTVSITSNDQWYEFVVTGVAEDVPNNSSLQFDVAISFANYDDIRLGGNNWGGRTSTYISLAEGYEAADLEAALPPFIETQFTQYIQSLSDAGYLKQEEDVLRMWLQPLAAMHQSPDVWVPYEEAPHNPMYSLVMAGIGILILLIACFNFMILSIGLSTSRAREVGMRKVLGAQRSQLIGQFWGEALLQTSFGLLLGLALAAVAVPWFSQLSGRELSLSVFNGLDIAILIIGLLFVVGFVAGGYPSLMLSGFQPIKVLKGVFTAGGKNRFSRVLVVFQYTISIAFIISTFLMSQQLRYLFDRDLGYNKEMVMVVHTHQVSRSDAPLVLEYFRNTLLPEVSVDNIARIGSSFTRGSDRNTWTDSEGVTRSAYNFGIDFNYIELMDMEIVDGRNFSPDLPSDSTRSVLVNEALVREFGIENPVGKRLSGWLDWIYEESPVIIGVVKDYHYRSLREEVAPAVMNMHPDYYNYMGAMLIKIKPENVQQTINRVEGAWAEVLPGKAFSYSFLDEDVATQYQTEERWQNIVILSAFFAVLIASLGLFGLATLTVAKRTREIGIRKVLGADVQRVVVLITSDFVKLVALAALLASPLAFFSMQRWMGNFAYHIDISIWPFVLASLAAVGIAVLTISSRAIRAALTNPIYALKNDG